MVIKRIDPMSAAKVSGILGVLLGLVIGACMSLLFMVWGTRLASDNHDAGAMAGMMFGAGSIIIFPICYGVFLFIMGAIQAALYNLASKWVGGLQIEAS